MGKAARLKRLRKLQVSDLQNRMSESITKNFQKQIRESEIWEQMVEQFGEEKAYQILKGCKAEVKPGSGL